MNIELSRQQFRYLLDLVYIGNWVLNSTRENDRIKEYDQVESPLPPHKKRLSAKEKAKIRDPSGDARGVPEKPIIFPAARTSGKFPPAERSVGPRL